MFGVESIIRFQFKDVCQQKHDIIIVLNIDHYQKRDLFEFTSIYRALSRDRELRNGCNNIKIIALDFHGEWKVINLWSKMVNREVEEYLASNRKDVFKYGTKNLMILKKDF